MRTILILKTTKHHFLLSGTTFLTLTAFSTSLFKSHLAHKALKRKQSVISSSNQNQYVGRLLKVRGIIGRDVISVQGSGRCTPKTPSKDHFESNGIAKLKNLATAALHYCNRILVDGRSEIREDEHRKNLRIPFVFCAVT